MNAAPSLHPPGLVDDLFSRLAPRRSHVAAAWVLALLLHAGLGAFALGHRASEPLAAVPLEVELLPPPPPPPPPPEPEPKPEPEPPPRAPEPVAPKPVVQRAPAAAAAANVLTARPEPSEPAAPEPFDFTTDPNSTVLGSGVVAVGGSATHGVQGAQANGTGNKPVVAAPAGDGLVAASDLSRKPSLPGRDPCKGYFPARALDDVAYVVLRVTIAKDGAVRNTKVVSESVQGQGFGGAAQTCMQRQTFEPALDRDGRAAATAMTINVTFSR
jgi:periplasmic protein TonB